MTNQHNSYRNNYSFMFGVLCLLVVYLHSEWAGGFATYTLGASNHIIKSIGGLLLMAVVPSFFILWGYLSSKYFYNNTTPFIFFRKKLIQFYPIYLFSFILSVIINSGHVLSMPRWKVMLSLLGLYYESGMRNGGHIYLVVFSVIVTITFFKQFQLKQKSIFVFTLVCLLISKLFPHYEANICYIVYFGYYTAFFLGVTLKHLNTFDYRLSLRPPNYKHTLSMVIIAVGLITPLLNFFKIYALEMDYNPNTPEQLFFCVLLIFIANTILDKYRLTEKKFFPFKIVHKIGNNAYGHFIIQSHIIRLLIFLNTFIGIGQLPLQIIIIFSTSIIVVYFFLPAYKKMGSVIIHK